MDFVTPNTINEVCTKLFGETYLILPSTAAFLSYKINPLLETANTSTGPRAALLTYIHNVYPWIITHGEDSKALYRGYGKDVKDSLSVYLAESIIGFIINRVGQHVLRHRVPLPHGNVITIWDVLDTFATDVINLYSSELTHIYNTEVDINTILQIEDFTTIPVFVNSEAYAMTEEYLTGLLICQHLTQGTYSLTAFGVDFSQEYLYYANRYSMQCEIKPERYSIFIGNVKYCFNNSHLVSGFVVGCKIENVNDLVYWRDFKDQDGQVYTIIE